ncbi:MAG: NAD(P)-dependent oxidoreductase [Bacteroidales bacterium]
MKKIVLIGASGFVGSAIMKEALNRGHKVTAVVRNTEKITTLHKNLIIKQGDVSLIKNVTEICRGAEAVISAYNPGWKNPDIAEQTTRVYKTILTGVRESGVKRLLVVGGAASLFGSDGRRLMDAGIMPDSYLPAVRALAEIYLVDLMAEKNIDWVFFSPAGMLEQGLRTGKFRLGKDDLIVNEKGESKISVQDYAVAMIDELEKPAHHRERFTIGY